MKRNNKENGNYGKSSRKSGNFKASPRNERPERDNRFFEERGERNEKSDKPSYNKSKEDWGKNSERNHKSSPGSYDKRRGGRTQEEGRSSYNKFSPGRRERSDSGSKPPYKKFGSEWAEKPRYGKSDPDRRESSTSEDKPPFKKHFSERADKSDGASFKTLYKGRGRDQKPRFETVRKEDTDQKRPSKKFFSKSRVTDNGPMESKPTYDFKKYENTVKKNDHEDEIRLNKYIANAGVCSRREADSLIEKGLVSVNGTVIKEMGHKVLRKDNVQYQGKILNPEKPVYVLLNKPKDFITTTDDPMERKTVMGLVSSACDERIFPVGRLDRNTTGLLLFTNDGELADKLASPANNVKKIYQVTLDMPLAKKDADAILEGITLEDGLVEVDDMQVLSKDRTILGLEIHIGRNRIVRRIFAHLGYEVVSLDRVVYAGLTKKDLSRGNYRFLSEKEVINLKFFS